MNPMQEIRNDEHNGKSDKWDNCAMTDIENNVKFFIHSNSSSNKNQIVSFHNAKAQLHGSFLKPLYRVSQGSVM